MDSDLIALYILLTKSGYTPLKLRNIFIHGTSPSRFLEQFPQLENHSLWQKEWEELQTNNISLLSYLDPLYPSALRTLSDFPLLLYVYGKLLPQDAHALAIVGTRTSTHYGMEQAHSFAETLAAEGMTIVSGLARGIDTAAHQGALKRGRTLAFLGSGLGSIYPKENTKLVEAIAAQGAVISEFPLMTPPFRTHFPQRNRLVSGFSKGVLLIESPLKGGGMLTMGIAEKQRKPLFAIPGRVDMPTFQGNHALLKHKKAQFVDSSDDILHFFSLPLSQKNNCSSIVLTEEERGFLSLLSFEEKSMDELVLLTQFPVMKLNVLLTRLVLKKAMKEFPGKIYKKVYQDLNG